MKKKLGFLIVALSLLVAACGGDSDGSDVRGASEAVDSSTESSQGADDDNAVDSPVDESSASELEEPTVVAAEPEETASSTDDSSGDSSAATDDATSPISAEIVRLVNDADDWCTAAAGVEEGTAVLDTIDFTDPQELELAYRGAQELVSASLRLAPDEILADVEQSIDGFATITDALEEAEWSFLDLDLSVIEDIDDEMNLATYNIERYNFDTCSIGSDPGEPPVPFEDVLGDDSDLPVEGTIRDQAMQSFIDGGFTAEEAGCIVDAIDFSNPERLSDPSALISVFTDCGIPLERLAQLGG